MNFELLIDSNASGVTLALLKNKKLLELHEERGNNNFGVGDIYLGKVKKIIPSLNAAFIDVGYEKDAFLHYLDLGPQFLTVHNYSKRTLEGKQNTSNLMYFEGKEDIPKEGKISDHLSHGQPILVQIAKEPISSKGPRLSAEVTIPGRYLVLVPFSNKVSISQKIKSEEERSRLRDLMRNVKPKNFGVIIRTVAENKKVADLEQDLNDLVNKWESLYQALKKNPTPPKRVLGEDNKTTTVLRDMLTENFSNIYLNDERLLEEVKSYVKTIAPGKENIARLHKSKMGMFEEFGIHKQIKAMFGKQVMLPSGGYLIIEHTEAMHVVDVNSGNRKAIEGASQEENAFQTNLEAAEELVRILRLRDMGGIIAVDFIDMYEKENNRKLYDFLKEAMRSDRAKHNVLPPSKFGVVEITRQRVRPETDIKTTEKCPSCGGTGEIEASVLFVELVEMQLEYLINETKEKHIALHVHPYIEAYLKKGLYSIQMKWYFKYKKWIPIRGASDYHFLAYHFFNRKGEEVIWGAK